MIYLNALGIIAVAVVFFYAGYLHGWARHSEKTIKAIKEMKFEEKTGGGNLPPYATEDMPPIEDIPGYEEHRENKLNQE